MKKGCKHQHRPPEGKPLSPQSFLKMFECCLKDTPPPLPEKILNMRESLQKPQILETVFRPGEKFLICSDMIVEDLLFTFPYLRAYFEEHHPLGLLSPVLHQTTLEMYFADLPEKIENVCTDLSTLIARKEISHG